MSNEAKGPYKCRVVGLCSGEVVHEPTNKVVSRSNNKDEAYSIADMMNYAHHSALTSQAARVKEFEEDREWLRSQWERHRKALNAIAWGEYDNVAFCRRLAQDELAIGVKVANDRAAATVAALTPKEPQQ